jgi:hypothetical protein
MSLMIEGIERGKNCCQTTYLLLLVAHVRAK